MPSSDIREKTLKTAIHCTGTGLHGGAKVSMTLNPAPAGTGIVFRRTDVQGAGAEIPAAPKNIRAIFTQDDDGEWKYARYFDPSGVEPTQFEMYYLRNGLGLPVDPFEIDNLANEASSQYDNPVIAAKREQLAQRLATLEAERLQPLNSNIYLPLIQA